MNEPLIRAVIDTVGTMTILLGATYLVALAVQALARKVAKSLRGDLGYTGADGPQGPMGPPGAVGPMGPKGEKGDSRFTADQARVLQQIADLALDEES